MAAMPAARSLNWPSLAILHPLKHAQRRATSITLSMAVRSNSGSAQSPKSSESGDHAKDILKQARIEIQKAQKTMAELDEELRLTMEERSGEGGEAGAELEDGKAVGLKRGVRENMFRVI